MKRSLLAVAILGAYAGVASAQSSVTLFGVVDVAGRVVKNEGQGRRYTLQSGALNSSRIGFRGVEDLGGGLKAGFWVEADIQADNGFAGGTANGVPNTLFNRRSTGSLLNQFGELRLGRDLTPSSYATFIYDPFGVVGIGGSAAISHNTVQTTYFRATNSIAYLTPPNIGGFFGHAMVSAGEGGAGKYRGGRVGFAAGPFEIAVATSKADVVAGGATNFRFSNVGGAWDFGFAKLFAHYNREELRGGVTAKEDRWLVGGIVRLGQGEIKASYVRTNEKTSLDRDASHYTVGYVYNLSKRTAMYTHVSRIDNKSNSNFAISGGAPGITPGGNSTGAELGVRHFF